MATLHLAPRLACAAVLAAGVERDQLHPVYRTLGEHADRDAPEQASVPPSLGEADLALVRAQVTAPAVLAIAAIGHGRTHRLRIALGHDGAGVERDGGREWTHRELSELPGLIADLLPARSPLGAAPRLTQEHPSQALSLNETQAEQLRARIAAGDDVPTAIGSLEDLDERLRDALTVDGERVSASLTLHSPDPALLAEPVSFGRLWSVGELGMYRTDMEGPPLGAVVPVEPGDVLGTVLPLLEEGVRFAAHCAEGGR